MSATVWNRDGTHSRPANDKILRDTLEQQDMVKDIFIANTLVFIRRQWRMATIFQYRNDAGFERTMGNEVRTITRKMQFTSFRNGPKCVDCWR